MSLIFRYTKLYYEKIINDNVGITKQYKPYNIWNFKDIR